MSLVGVAAVLAALAVAGVEITAPAGLACLCLALWLFEAVPVFVPSLLLLALAPLATDLPVPQVMQWFADPVLVLFFGGFALGEAAVANGIDRRIVAASIRAARGRAAPLVAVVLGSTAFLSMWISNVAAAALVIAALKPALPDRLVRPVLLSAALGANLGGMATPIGSGPNAIAIAAMPHPPSFLGWMAMALPLTIGAAVVAFVWIVGVLGARGAVDVPDPQAPRDGERPRALAAVAVLAIALWLSETVHGIPPSVVAVGTAAVLFGTGLLPRTGLARLDWSTLLLIAGGLGLGGLLEHVGFVDRVAELLSDLHAPRTVVLGALLVSTAALSSLMSNTATVTLLVPAGMAVLPDAPGAPILVALAASFGMMFVISTPPNAMAVGAGVRPADLLWPGLVLLAGGCAVLALTGPWVLSLLGL